MSGENSAFSTAVLFLMYISIFIHLITKIVMIHISTLNQQPQPIHKSIHHIISDDFDIGVVMKDDVCIPIWLFSLCTWWFVGHYFVSEPGKILKSPCTQRKQSYVYAHIILHNHTYIKIIAYDMMNWFMYWLWLLVESWDVYHCYLCN